MLKHIKGDLVEMAIAGKFDTIMHGCNCFHTMGAGIAATIARNFPHARKADEETKLGDISKLGYYSVGYATPALGLDTLDIVNLYTQYRPGPHAEYLAIISSLRSCIENERPRGNDRIGIPWIGAGIGGLEIDIVKDIIEDICREYSIDITMVEFVPPPIPPFTCSSNGKY